MLQTKKTLKKQGMNKGNGFDSPSRKDISFLFKDKENFEQKEEIIDLLFNAVKKPSLMGLDYADIAKIVSSNSKFKLIKTFYEKIETYQSLIDESKGVIVVLNGGPDDTLGFFTDILENHFSKAGFLVPIGFINKKVKNGNPFLEFVLANR